LEKFLPLLYSEQKIKRLCWVAIPISDNVVIVVILLMDQVIWAPSNEILEIYRIISLTEKEFHLRIDLQL